MMQFKRKTSGMLGALGLAGVGAVLAGLSAFLSGGTVLAADPALAPSGVSMPVLPASDILPIDWSGFYTGIAGGYRFDNGSEGAAVNSKRYEINGDLGGTAFGGFFGYNWQFDNGLVLGVEGEIGYTFNETKRRFSIMETKLAGTLQGGVSGRAGYAFNRFLVYGTAGWYGAYVQADYGSKTLSKSVDEFISGPGAGAGVDYAFTENVFARLQYTYTRFDDTALTDAFGPIPAIHADVNQSRIMVGLGIRY